jgi:asparagine synthase (glutamine-hydrolysing)
LPPFLRRIAGLAGNLGARLADLPRTGDAGELARWRRRFLTDEAIRRAGLPIVAEPPDVSVALPDDFARISWAELTGYMRRMLLRDADQMSMAVSLEMRVPFLDHELLEYVLGLQVAEKRRYGGVKGLLVEACRDLLPASVYDRPKTGFVLPMKQWIAGPLAPFVVEGVQETISRRLLPELFVNEMRAAFQRGRLHWTRLWSLVVLGHYAKRQQLVCSQDENSPIHPHG